MSFFERRSSEQRNGCRRGNKEEGKAIIARHRGDRSAVSHKGKVRSHLALMVFLKFLNIIFFRGLEGVAGGLGWDLRFERREEGESPGDVSQSSKAKFVLIWL